MCLTRFEPTGPINSSFFRETKQRIRPLQFDYNCTGLYRYTLFYTATYVHFTIKQVLQIIHASLAIENSFMKSVVRGTNGPVFMLTH